MTSGTATAAKTAARVPRISAAERRHLEVVRNRRRVRTGVLSSVAVTLVFASLFGLAAMQAVLVQGQLELDQVEQGIANLKEERGRLETNLAALEAPDLIAAKAKAEGMVPPPEVITIPAVTGEDEAVAQPDTGEAGE